MNSRFKSQPSDDIALSIIVPCYNEEEVLPIFHQRLSLILQAMTLKAEVLYVDDGSSDNSASLLEQFSREPRVRHLSLSRNFGKEGAMAAGVDSAYGEAIIFIDADLQDPPELIPLMVEKWQQGYEVVNMQRSDRRVDGPAKRLSAMLYYRVMARANPQLNIHPEVSDFRLLGKRAVAELRRMPERSRTIKSLVSWIGFRSIQIPYQRDHRAAGCSKWNFLQLMDLAVSSIISVSNRPLRWFSYLSFLLILVTGGQLTYRMFNGGFQQLDLLGVAVACIALGLALVGEYLAVILQESRGRALYILDPKKPQYDTALTCRTSLSEPSSVQQQANES